MEATGRTSPIRRRIASYVNSWYPSLDVVCVERAKCGVGLQEEWKYPESCLKSSGSLAAARVVVEVALGGEDGDVGVGDRRRVNGRVEAELT